MYVYLRLKIEKKLKSANVWQMFFEFRLWPFEIFKKDRIQEENLTISFRHLAKLHLIITFQCDIFKFWSTVYFSFAGVSNLHRNKLY